MLKTIGIIITGMLLLTGCSEDPMCPADVFSDSTIPTDCADCSDQIIATSNEYGTADNSRYINNGDYWKWTWTYRDDEGNVTDIFTFEEDPSSSECCGFTHHSVGGM